MEIIVDGHKVLIDNVDYELYCMYRLRVKTRSIDDYKCVMFVSGPHDGQSLARVILNTPRGFDTDHRNRNPLDNQRSNLRIATRQQNNANCKGRSKSGLPRGVTKEGPSYRAYIRWNYTKYYLGSFATAEAAHTAYCIAARKYFGEFAYKADE